MNKEINRIIKKTDNYIDDLTDSTFWKNLKFEIQAEIHELSRMMMYRVIGYATSVDKSDGYECPMKVFQTITMSKPSAEYLLNLLYHINKEDKTDGK